MYISVTLLTTIKMRKSKPFSTNPLKCIKTLVLACILLISPAFAQNPKVAAAANMQPVIKALQVDFKQKTGIAIEPVLGSSGNLATQIRNGAPFDVFLSADMEFPEALYKNGLCLQKPVVYAQGSLVICSNQNIGFENWERVLMSARIKKIAVGNPAIAPYGKAAEEALRFKGIWNEIRNKFVFGESIGQVNTYISTGAVEVGFTALAFVKDRGNKQRLYWHIVDPKAYKPIRQAMVIFKHAANNPAAEKFYRYMLTAPAKKILETYGYHVQQDTK
ncbi:molybdate ABC transporter substrate-binding protein [soil metagenome]